MDEIKKTLLEMADEAYAQGYAAGKREAVIEIMKAAGFPAGQIKEISSTKPKRAGKPAKEAEKIKIPKDENPLVMRKKDLIKKFGELPIRKVDRNELEKILIAGKVQYAEEELDSLEGGECVGMYDDQMMIFEKL